MTGIKKKDTRLGEQAEDDNKLDNGGKTEEYLKTLEQEISLIDQNELPIAYRFLIEEIAKVRSLGRIPQRERKLDLFRDKPTKLAVKVKLPSYPKLNFIGKLLGPKGNTLKRLQEETQCRITINGRDSMRNKEKEEELRNSKDPKYDHLFDELHVEIVTIGAPAEAYGKIANALAEVKKYLSRDYRDEIAMEQMREMVQYRRVEKYGSFGIDGRRENQRPFPGPQMGAGNDSVMSILSRVRGMPQNRYSANPPQQPRYSYNEYYGKSGYDDDDDDDFPPMDHDSENDDYEPIAKSGNGTITKSPLTRNWRPTSALYATPAASASGFQQLSLSARYRDAPYSRRSPKRTDLDKFSFV